MNKIKFLSLTLVITVFLLIIEAVVIKNAIGYENKKPVIVAKSIIEEGTTITKEMLKVVEFNAKDMHSNYISSFEGAVGKKPQQTIKEGDLVLLSSVDSTQDDFAHTTKEDARYFCLEFKGDQANGWWIKEGQLVDIIFIPNFKSLEPEEQEAQKNALKASGIIKGGGVWRLGKIKIAAIIDENGKIIKNSRERMLLPKFISFEVTPEQDTFLAYAKGAGRLEISALPKK